MHTKTFRRWNSTCENNFSPPTNGINYVILCGSWQQTRCLTGVKIMCKMQILTLSPSVRGLWPYTLGGSRKQVAFVFPQIKWHPLCLRQVAFTPFAFWRDAYFPLRGWRVFIFILSIEYYNFSSLFLPFYWKTEFYIYPIEKNEKLKKCDESRSKTLDEAKRES